MRKLQTQDIFAAMRAISKANLKEEIKPVIKKISEGQMNIKDAGIEGMLSVIEIFTKHNSEQAIYEVLAGPFEATAEEIKKLDLDKLTENLEILGRENDLKRFFTLLAGLIIKKQ